METHKQIINSPQAFISTYEEGLASQSWAEIAPLIHENCAVTFSAGTHIGKVAVEAAFRKTFALIKEEKYKISDTHWIRETENSAVLIFQFSWSGIIEGKFASGSGRGTSVLTNENGKWQLICEHLGPPAR